MQSKIEELKEENKILRKYLWLNHGCESHCLYGDDGEMQCNCCLIDFKRNSIKKIVQIFDNKSMDAAKSYFKKMSEQSKE